MTAKNDRKESSAGEQFGRPAAAINGRAARGRVLSALRAEREFDDKGRAFVDLALPSEWW